MANKTNKQAELEVPHSRFVGMPSKTNYPDSEPVYIIYVEEVHIFLITLTPEIGNSLEMVGGSSEKKLLKIVLQLFILQNHSLTH